MSIIMVSREELRDILEDEDIHARIDGLGHRESVADLAKVGVVDPTDYLGVMNVWLTLVEREKGGVI